MDAQADLSLRWAHIHFVGFVISWLKYSVDLDQPPHSEAFDLGQHCLAVSHNPVNGLAGPIKIICFPFKELIRPHVFYDFDQIPFSANHSEFRAEQNRADMCGQ